MTSDRVYNAQMKEGRYLRVKFTSKEDGAIVDLVFRSGVFDDVRLFMFIVSLHHINVFVLLFSRRNGIRLHLERDA